MHMFCPKFLLSLYQHYRKKIPYIWDINQLPSSACSHTTVNLGKVGMIVSVLAIIGDYLKRKHPRNDIVTSERPSILVVFVTILTIFQIAQYLSRTNQCVHYYYHQLLLYWYCFQTLLNIKLASVIAVNNIS